MSKSFSLEQLIIQRRTPNPALFIDKSLPFERIKQCIQTSRFAPNHKRTEPTRFYWASLEQKDALGQLFYDHIISTKGASEIELATKKKHVWANCPGILVVTNFSLSDDKLAVKMPELHKENYATCSAIIQNLTLLLLEQDIHVKWSTAAVKNTPKFRDIMGLHQDPETEDVVGILLMGYLPESFSQPPRTYKPLDEIFRS